MCQRKVKNSVSYNDQIFTLLNKSSSRLTNIYQYILEGILMQLYTMYITSEQCKQTIYVHIISFNPIVQSFIYNDVNPTCSIKQ